MDTNETTGLPRRVVNVVVVVVLTLAVVGYFIGTQPSARHQSAGPALAASTVSGTVPGQTYLQLRERRYGPNAKVRSDLEAMRGALPALSTPVRRTPEQHAAALEARAQRRAYDGAPPVVPHPIDEQNSASCLACHRDGLVVQGKVARAMSHPAYASCTQCHVTTEPRLPKPELPANAFAGFAPDRPTVRAAPGAPPSIPHSVWMRDDCSSCHGVAGLPGLRTTHPERRSCTQCHVGDEDRTPPGAKR